MIEAPQSRLMQPVLVEAVCGAHNHICFVEESTAKDAAGSAAFGSSLAATTTRTGRQHRLGGWQWCLTKRFARHERCYLGPRPVCSRVPRPYSPVISRVGVEIIMEAHSRSTPCGWAATRSCCFDTGRAREASRVLLSSSADHVTIRDKPGSSGMTPGCDSRGRNDVRGRGGPSGGRWAGCGSTTSPTMQSSMAPQSGCAG